MLGGGMVSHTNVDFISVLCDEGDWLGIAFIGLKFACHKADPAIESL